jgi:hypothetical protein
MVASVHAARRNLPVLGIAHDIFHMRDLRDLCEAVGFNAGKAAKPPGRGPL